MEKHERQTVFQQHPKAQRLYWWTVTLLTAAVAPVVVELPKLFIDFKKSMEALPVATTITMEGLIALTAWVIAGFVLRIVALSSAFRFSPSAKIWIWLSFVVVAPQVLSPYARNRTIVILVLIAVAAFCYRKTLKLIQQSEGMAPSLRE